MKVDLIQDRKLKIAVIGLGYVGLPLAVEFGKIYDTVGFDKKVSRLEMLRSGVDSTLEVSSENLAAAKLLKYSSDLEDLRDRDVFIVAVPTPIDCYNRPDLSPLIGASTTVGKAMKKGAVVIFESTVYPGCTEEDCVPVLERESHMKFNVDFYCGYSPDGSTRATSSILCGTSRKSRPVPRRRSRISSTGFTIRSF